MLLIQIQKIKSKLQMYTINILCFFVKTDFEKYLVDNSCVLEYPNMRCEVRRKFSLFSLDLQLKIVFPPGRYFFLRMSVSFSNVIMNIITCYVGPIKYN